MNTEKLVAALETVALAIEDGTLKPVRVDEHTMLVLRHPGVLSDMARVHIKEFFSRAFPGAQVVLLEEGMDIAALGLACTKPYCPSWRDTFRRLDSQQRARLGGES